MLIEDSIYRASLLGATSSCASIRQGQTYGRASWHQEKPTFFVR